MFLATFCIIAKKPKQPNCPSIDELINKMCYSYTRGYYMAIQNEGTDTTWMNLESIIVGERSQPQKTT